MTEPRQDSPSDPQLSRLYRQYSTGEPSNAVDERILAAARAAVSGRPGTSAWWRRWRTPLALATTLVLSLTLASLHERPPGGLPSEHSPDQQVLKAPGKAPRSSATAVDQTRPAPALEPAEPVAAAATSGLQGTVAAKAAQPAPAASRERDSQVRSDSAVKPGTPAVPEKKAFPVTRPPEQKLESAPAPAAATGAVTDSRNEARLEATPVGGRAAVPGTAKSRMQTGRTPDAWLDEIRTLRREGKSQEAERQLDEFRRANPDYPLPEEFRQ